MAERKTTEQFIKDAVKVHGDKYDYSLVEYTGANGKVKIICREHGIFEKSATHHLSGGSCKKCSLRIKNFGRSTTEEFIKKAKLVHGNEYDYSEVDYIRADKKVNVTCNSCGNTFQISPNNHINKKGCKECGIKRRTKKLTLTNENYIERCNKTHNNFYNYSKVRYINGYNKVIIGCPIHEDFEQEANSHLHGVGCPKCALEIDTFRRSHYIKLAEKATLYLIKIYNEHEVFYKLGKTIGKIKRRFAGKQKLPYNFIVINEYNSEIGEIFDLEIALHREYKKYQYFPKINFKGYTECYTMQLPIEEIINNKLQCQNL